MKQPPKKSPAPAEARAGMNITEQDADHGSGLAVVNQKPNQSVAFKRYGFRDLIETRLDGLDRAHRVAGFYYQVNGGGV
jgi:hypothetical protein